MQVLAVVTKKSQVRRHVYPEYFWCWGTQSVIAYGVLPYAHLMYTMSVLSEDKTSQACSTLVDVSMWQRHLCVEWYPALLS